MSEELFKNVKQLHARTIPSDIPPVEFKPSDVTLEDALAMKAFNAFVWQSPTNKEQRERLQRMINNGRIKHIIKGRPRK